MRKLMREDKIKIMRENMGNDGDGEYFKFRIESYSKLRNNFKNADSSLGKFLFKAFDKLYNEVIDEL